MGLYLAIGIYFMHLGTIPSEIPSSMHFKEILREADPKAGPFRDRAARDAP
jgi:hypothetical protein